MLRLAPPRQRIRTQVLVTQVFVTQARAAVVAVSLLPSVLLRRGAAGRNRVWV